MEDDEISAHPAAWTRRPLRLIFWGGILCVIDFSINGCDILNDTVGSILIALGVRALARAGISGRYTRIMRWVKIVAYVWIAKSIVRQIPDLNNSCISYVMPIIQLAGLAGIISFCICMQWLAQAFWLNEAARSWRVTTLLFLGIYAVPLGILYLVGFVAQFVGGFSYQFGAEALLALVVFLIPLVHLFISTSRMIQVRQGADEPVRGFPIEPNPPGNPPPFN